MSRLLVEPHVESLPILETFPDEQLMSVSHAEIPWYADIVNYLVTEQMPSSWTKQEKCRFLSMAKWYFWDEPYLFKYCPDQII